MLSSNGNAAIGAVAPNGVQTDLVRENRIRPFSVLLTWINAVSSKASSEKIG